MRADHHAPSGALHLEHGFPSSSRQPVPDLGTLVNETLRTAVAAMREGAPYSSGLADRDPMRELCAAARASDVRAETLILAIKDVWRRSPESQGVDRLESEATLAKVITRCIKEYYGPRRP